MTVCVKVDRATGKILERRDIDTAGRALSKPVVMLPEVVDSLPPFSPETEKLVRVDVLPPKFADLALPVNPDAVLHGTWTVEPLSPAELLTRRNAKLDMLDRPMPRALEDVVERLIAKSLVPKADWPKEVIDKINAKRALRGEAPL